MRHQSWPGLDFVENSEHCPLLIKEEFEDSQKRGDENEFQALLLAQEGTTVNPLPDQNYEKDQNAIYMDYFNEAWDDADENFLFDNIQGEAGEDVPLDDHQLYLGLNDPTENVAPEEPAQDNDNSDSDYDSRDFVREARTHDWQTSRTTDEIAEMRAWIENQKDEARLEEPDYSNIDVSRLNHKQTLAYNMVCDWVRRVIQDPDGTPPFYLNLCGSAGCGKTFWLKAVTKFVLEEAKGRRLLIKAAPTGKAATQIDGYTYHSLLKIPVPIPVRGKSIPDLDDNRLRDLQEDFYDCRLLVIDEKSMMGSEMLNIIDQRLRQIKGKPRTPFGGISIIIMGDFAQLPPVGDRPLYAKSDTKSKLNKCQEMGAALYDLFTDVIIFNQIMRQQGDEEKEFRDVLGRLSDGTITLDDWKWLQKQNFDEMSNSQQHEFKFNGVTLCAKRRDCKAQNILRIHALGTTPCPIQAVNKPIVAKQAQPTTAGGLDNSTIIAKNAQVYITTNIWKEAGVTNGTMCTVREIIYTNGKTPPELPTAVLVHIPDYKGPSYSESEPNIVPIVPIRRQFNFKKQNCTREMIPLQPGYALTIHKAQGASYPFKVTVDLGDKDFALGLSYVALSRCTKISNLALKPFPNWVRFRDIKNKPAFKARKAEDDRAASREQITLERGFLGEPYNSVATQVEMMDVEMME